jgi:hypothetical protein
MPGGTGAAARKFKWKFKGAAEPALPGRSRPAPWGQGAQVTVGPDVGRFRHGICLSAYVQSRHA